MVQAQASGRPAGSRTFPLARPGHSGYSGGDVNRRLIRGIEPCFAFTTGARGCATA